MVALQAINKILHDKDFSFIEKANITRDYFNGYEAEFDFIENHIKKYKIVPDITTFIDRFPEFEVVDVIESEQYLVDKLREEYTYLLSIPIFQEASEMFKQDSRMAVEYIKTKLDNIKLSYGIKGIDIIADAKKRYDELLDKKENKANWYFASGFPELDLITNGIQRKEEFIVIFARTSQGKSWIAEKMAVSIWEQGFNVGYFSPEMTDTSIGYRFDTLFRNFSNYHLVHGKDNDEVTEYRKYIRELSKHKNKFLVTTPLDFDKKTTVSKIRNWILDNDLHAVIIDGISYLHDERYRRGDNVTTGLTNISEDLMSLSVELHVPVIGVVQANREAAGEEKTTAPLLETIRNSDGIAHNASKAFSIRIKNGVLEINIQKHRNGEVGNRLLYNYDINFGKFTYLPNPKSGLDEIDNKIAENQKAEYQDIEAVF